MRALISINTELKRRQVSMRANLQSNIKVQIALKMIEDMQERGMIKFEELTIFQAALPMALMNIVFQI